MTLAAGSVPDPARPHLSLFNTEAFYDLRFIDWVPLHLFANAVEVGTLVTAATQDGYLNGQYAPYGGIDWHLDRVPPETIHDALAAVPFVTAPNIEIRCAPTHHSPAQAATLVSLHRLGFRARAAELSYWIPLPATLDEYERGLKHEARVALARTQETYTACWLAPDDDEGWTAAYDLLDANRRAKGRRMSVDLDYLLRLRDTFPDLVRAVCVHDRDQWRAAAIVYRVRRGCDYVSWWGHDASLPGRSPMNVLARAVVAESIQTGARALDLGVSSNDGVPDAGLCRFKRSVGALPEVRWTLCR